MRLTIFSAFLVLIQFFYVIQLQAQRVYVNDVDTINVWLFSDKTVYEVTISARFGALNLILDSQKTIPISKDEVFKIKKSSSVFKIQKGDNTFLAKEILVQSNSNTLINVITRESGYKYFFGTLLFNQKTGLKPVNRVSLEDYVSSVVGSEMNFIHPEALKVQAVISRTYALWNLGNTKKSWYHVTDHTMTQVYNGEAIEKPWFREAAFATKGEVALYGDKLILAVFSSTCGGFTSNNESTWSGKALPYLRGHSDHDACKDSPHFFWKFGLSTKEWKHWISTQTSSKNYHLKATEINPDGRLNRISLVQSNQKTADYSWKANDFRLRMIRSFGPKSIKSTFFTIEQTADSILFTGKGMGHGIGVCQWGALGLSESGWNYQDILRFYYGGIEIKNVYFNSDKTFLELAN